jgi:hypothetical protein
MTAQIESQVCFSYGINRALGFPVRAAQYSVLRNALGPDGMRAAIPAIICF